jgi:predicted acylesterase/phospholipase RssA
MRNACGRTTKVLFVAAVALTLGACATVHNLPLNTPSANPIVQSAGTAAATAARFRQGEQDGAVIGIAFSGGGTRAAAFGYGVLDRMARTPLRPGKSGNLLNHVGLVSGVSGGSVIAAYYGLKGEAALADFRSEYLTQDPMAALDTSINLVNIDRALGGGANTDNRLRDWFNAHLYHNATFGDLMARQRPIVVINATDIYNRSPFLFGPLSFAAACSDITRYPVAAAVAASSAVPAVFAPVVIETFPGDCQTPLPPWIERASADRSAAPLLHAYARGLKDIREGRVKYVKLFDGGLIDNFGLSSFTILRAGQTTPYGPLRPEEAVNLRRFLFLVADAGQGPQGNWSKTLEGPAGKELIGAVVDVLVDANAHTSFSAFEATMHNWQNEIVRWRCGLTHTEVARLRQRGGPWNCRDLKITVARVSFDQLDTARAQQLNKVPTSFTLPAETVDAVARAGGDALEANPAFRAFLKEM